MPHGMPYRHPLTIAKPVIGGVQTAFVVGRSGMVCSFPASAMR